MAKTERIKIKLDVDVDNKDLLKTDKSLNNIKSTAKKAGNEVEEIGDSAKKSVPGMKKLEKSTDDLNNSAKNVGMSFKSMAGFLAGAIAIDSIVEYGNELDDMEARITTIARGQDNLFETFKNFDGRFLYDITDTLETLNKLRLHGVKVNSDILTTISDIALTSGEQIGTVADQYATALRGEEGSLNDYFKNVKTINGKLYGDYTKLINGKQEVFTVSLNNMQEIQAAFDSQYSGTTARKLATTAGQYELLKQKALTSFSELYKGSQPYLNGIMETASDAIDDVSVFMKENNQAIMSNIAVIQAGLEVLVDLGKLGFLELSGAWILFTDNMDVMFDKVAAKIDVTLQEIIFTYQKTVSAALNASAKLAGSNSVAYQEAAKYETKLIGTSQKLVKLRKDLKDIEIVISKEYKENLKDIEKQKKSLDGLFDDTENFMLNRIKLITDSHREEEKSIKLSEDKNKETEKTNENLKLMNLSLKDLVKEEEFRIENEKNIKKLKIDELKITNDLTDKEKERLSLSKRMADNIRAGVEAEKNRQKFGVSISGDKIRETKGIGIGVGAKGSTERDEFVSTAVGFEPYQNELDQMKEFNDKRIALAVEYGASKALIAEMEEQADNEIKEKKVQYYADGLSAMSSTFEQMYQMSGESSKELFYLHKSFAVAEAGIAMYQGMAEAMKLGWPAGIAAAAGAAAQGASLIANLSSMADPKFHDGGYIQNGGGENLRGDEKRAVLQTGEGVLSRKGMDALDKLNRGESKTINNESASFYYPNEQQATEAMLNSRVAKKMIKEIVK